MRGKLWILMLALGLLGIAPAARADEPPCAVCQPCESHADCGEGGLCAPMGEGRVCTRLCSPDVGCPGDALCWSVTDGEGDSLGFCFSPEAAFCPTDYVCEGGEVEEAASSVARGEDVCRYNGPPVRLVGQCDEGSEAEPCQVLRLVNAERARVDAPPLTYHPLLARAAQLHAVEMLHCDYFSHASLDGRTFSQRVVDVGYEGFPAAENIAAGPSTAEEVLETWMGSPGHRENILDPELRQLGVGYFTSEDDAYGSRWVQVFGY